MAVTLEINNQVYRTWTEIEVTRSLKRGSAMFSIETRARSIRRSCLLPAAFFSTMASR